MKYLLLLTVICITMNCYSQSFASLDGTLYNTDDIKPAWGVDFTGGAYLKNKDDKGKRSFMMGAGIGVYKFTENDFYAPLFATFGYFDRSKKISPYVNCRIGYGFYKGSANFIGKNEGVKGGLYANVRGGAGFKIGNKMHVTPFVGVTLMMLRKIQGAQTTEQYNSGLVNAGISLLFRGK